MPWQETDPVDQRRKFVMDLNSGLWTMTELCDRYGISRKTGYKLVHRVEAEGAAGLGDRSRAPRSCPHRTPSEIEELVLTVKQAHPSWGARKLLSWLARRHPRRTLPARSTVADLLARSGWVKPRRTRRRWKHPGRPAGEPKAANDLWTADFKGQFRTRDGVWCYPLTIADQASRYLLRCQALPNVRTEGAQPVFERLFREVGLPRAMRTDNGAPFASTGIHGLCAMSVWWIQLGIAPERIEPSHPEQNGVHERMHRTLKAETTRPPASTSRGQQRVFDRFRHEYNDERPHEALGDETPASRWRPSRRPYPERIAKPDYPGHFLVRLVSNAGNFRWHARQIFVSQALAQQWIGLEETDDGVWSMYFYDVLLARLDERTFKLSA